MKRTTKIATAIGLALGLGLGATALSAHPFGSGPGWGMGGPGWGMGGAGWGPGHMMGYGYGPGWGMGAGYGPGACFQGVGGGPGFGPGAAANPGEFFENRLAGLKSELKITSAQEGAWNAYAEEAKRQSESRRQWMTTMHGSGAASLPERIELRNQIWKQREAQSETMAQKLKDLYAVLTPEQKPIADQALGGWGPRGGFGPGYRYR
jgi:Spy/CpxP family protein refolding chaperone